MTEAARYVRSVMSEKQEALNAGRAKHAMSRDDLLDIGRHRLKDVRPCVYIYVYIEMTFCVSAYTCKCMYKYIYMYIYACMYVCVYVCVLG